MTGPSERLRRIAMLDRGPLRWAVGLVILIAGAVLLWFGIGSGEDDRYGEAAMPTSSSGDVVPPAEDGAEPATPGVSEAPTVDVIPPAEP